MKSLFLVLEKYKKNEEEIHFVKQKIKEIIFSYTSVVVDVKDLYIKKKSLYIEVSSIKKTKILQNKDKILSDFKKDGIEIYSLT